MRRKVIRRVALLFVLAAMPVSSQAQTGDVSVVGVSPSDPDGLVMRSGAGAGYAAVAHIPANAAHLRRLSCRSTGSARWCKVSYQQSIGWVNGRYLQAEAEVTAPSTANEAATAPALSAETSSDRSTKDDAVKLVSFALRCGKPGREEKGIAIAEQRSFVGATDRFMVRIVRHAVGVDDGKEVDLTESTKVMAPMSGLTPTRVSPKVVDLKCPRSTDCVEYTNVYSNRVTTRDNDSSWRFEFCDQDAADDFTLGMEELTK